MADINKFTTKEVLNKVLLDSSGNSVAANSHTSQEALNAVLDTSNNRLNVSLGGSNTISGDVTITGDLTVQGSATNTFDEQIQGIVQILGSTGTGATPAGTLQLTTSETTIVDNDQLGRIEFLAASEADGSDSQLVGASIAGEAEATFAADNNSTALVFSTNTSAAATERMRINSSGNVLIGTSSVINSTIGSTSAKFLDVDGGSYMGIITLARTTTGNGNNLGSLQFVNKDNADSANNDADGELVSYITATVATSDSNGGDDSGANLLFYTKSEAGSIAERMRINSDGTTTFAKGVTISNGNLDIASTKKLFFDAGGDTYIHEQAANKLDFFVGNGTRFVLDSNSRISLSNNDNNTGNTVFGSTAFNASSDNGSDNNTAIGYLAMGTGTVSGAEHNTAVGRSALTDITSANYNTAVGSGALANATTGERNVAIGADALGTAVNADSCVAIGNYAMGGANMTADGTVAIGKASMQLLTSGLNVGVGFQSGSQLTTGTQNTLIGYQAGLNINEGGRNTAVGHAAFGGSLSANGDESFDNTFIGFGSGAGDWSGASAVCNKNTAVGSTSMQGAMNGALDNTAIGYESLKALTTGDNNTAVGSKAMLDVTSGSYNVALGKESAQNLTDGQENVIIGDGAGQTTTSVHDVVVVGRGAMQNGNVTNDADGTVAVGYKSLEALVSGQKNTAIGFESLKTNVDGDQNTAVGYQSLSVFEANADGEGRNTAVGNASGINVTTGQHNTLIGVSTGSNTVALTTGSNNTLVGSLSDVSAAGASNQAVLGKGAKGVADNSVTLGNADVTAVYMAQDSGATIFCGDILSGRSSAGDTGNGHTIRSGDSALFSRDASGETMQICRNASDGQLIQFKSAGTVVGDIRNDGGTVSLTGFSGGHESSSSDSLEIGMVVSTIDEEHSKNHAKVEKSKTVGDKRVYGVVSNLEGLNGNNVTIASVGISSIKVIGSCEGGDLLESNGDGTAKVQSDDIIRSKTIGKVTMGNSTEEVKLVSCVLYCG